MPNIVDKQNLDVGFRNIAPRAASFLASFIGSFASPLPVNDQWSVAPILLGLKEGHFSLERLFAFHNEHLIVNPRSCFAALSFSRGTIAQNAVYVPANGDTVSFDLPRGIPGEREPIILGRCGAPRDFADAFPH